MIFPKKTICMNIIGYQPLRFRLWVILNNSKNLTSFRNNINSHKLITKNFVIICIFEHKLERLKMDSLHTILKNLDIVIKKILIVMVLKNSTKRNVRYKMYFVQKLVIKRRIINWETIMIIFRIEVQLHLTSLNVIKI